MEQDINSSCAQDMPVLRESGVHVLQQPSRELRATAKLCTEQVVGKWGAGETTNTNVLLEVGRMWALMSEI